MKTCIGATIDHVQTPWYVWNSEAGQDCVRILGGWMESISSKTFIADEDDGRKNYIAGIHWYRTQEHEGRKPHGIVEVAIGPVMVFVAVFQPFTLSGFEQMLREANPDVVEKSQEFLVVQHEALA